LENLFSSLLTIIVGRCRMDAPPTYEFVDDTGLQLHIHICDIWSNGSLAGLSNGSLAGLSNGSLAGLVGRA
jgi:hypothetical protein